MPLVMLQDLENTLHVLSIPSSSFNGDLTASPHMPVTYPSSTSLGPLTPSPSNLTDITSLSEPECAWNPLHPGSHTFAVLCQHALLQGKGSIPAVSSSARLIHDHVWSGAAQLTA